VAGTTRGTAARPHDSRAEVLRWAVEALRTRLAGVVAVYRFGSWGTPEERRDSDLDLAVLATAPLDPLPLFDTAQAVAAQVGREVDLIDLRRASTVLRAQVVAYGERIHCADPRTCETFEDTAFAAYARLNEERRGILDDIRQRGSVHGR
jgi:predicted nucleotidyltransferase